MINILYLQLVHFSLMWKCFVPYRHSGTQCNRDSLMMWLCHLELATSSYAKRVHGELITAFPCFSLEVLPDNFFYSKLDRISHMALLCSKGIEVFLAFFVNKKEKQKTKNLQSNPLLLSCLLVKCCKIRFKLFPLRVLCG